MGVLAGPAGVVRHLQIGVLVEGLEQGAGVFEEGFAQAQFDSFEVADTLAGEGLADEVQERVGFAELRGGDFRGRECFFFESGWASWARVSWSVTVMYCSDNCWKRR
jgi:hypothetical protein